MPYFGNIDWNHIRKRHADFWNGELTDSCLLSVYAPREGALRQSFPMPQNKEERMRWWLDAEQVIARFRAQASAMYYAGDAFPILNCNVGPACIAGFFAGSIPRFEDSIWYEHTLDDYADLIFDPNSLMYKTVFANAKIFANDANGDYVVGTPDISSAADAISHLRGPGNFLLDFVDRPDKLKRAINIALDVWEKTSTLLQDMLAKANFGGSSIAWLNTWAPGFMGQLQSDCSVMVSPDMFEAFLLRELTVQASKLEYSLYHLDGEEQIRHLPYILAIPELDVVQWTNVASRRTATSFIPQLQQIQAAGKGVLTGCTPAELPILLESLNARNLYLRVWANEEDEADAIVEIAKKLSRFY
ncbi:MAG: hypothetical protein FWC71_03580 [Defluviitaleaceae bacterium]|nr:hypothetical protein [Defluviitaleaceae bacterium]